MKKLLLIASIGLIALSSCKKEKNCHCGTIVNDAIITTPTGLNYTLSIKNKCSGNVNIFDFDEQTWFNAHVGEEFCVSNVSSW